MPYSIKDVDKHKKGLSDSEKKQWVAVANSVLRQCVEDGGDEAECAAKAIRQASGVLKEQEPGGPEVCECPECDYEQDKERGVPCRSVKCPECGAMLIAKEAESMPDETNMETTSAESDLASLRELLAQALALVDDKLAEQEGDELTETELAESASGHVIALAEQLPLPGADSIVPLHLDVALITPGWGNKRDNHYYPRDVVERDSGVFAGVKMYETDHRQDEKSTRTWVSTVKEITGYTADGAPIGRVSVHDKNFAERLMALAADELLEKMECSILANGTARKGEIDGKKGHIVEAITSADSVDWVTRAGCGGRALALAESENGGESMADEQTEVIEEQEPAEEPLEEVTLSEQEEPEPETPPEPLASEKVREMVEATNLPDAARARLSEREYADEAELEGAIGGEVAYIKEVTGSGRPFAQGAGSAPEKRPRTAEEADADFERILTEVGMPHLGGRS